MTAVAMIAYLNGSNGLALALTDEGSMNWSTAQTTCAAHTPAFTDGTWKLATKDEWDNMISAAGSYTALCDGFSSVGGTNMQSNYYWSSTGDDSDRAWWYFFRRGTWTGTPASSVSYSGDIVGMEAGNTKFVFTIAVESNTVPEGANTVPEGAINGVFSVSSTKKVYFSKGNLRYASDTWSFFDNQYDYYTSYSADACDKFCWSTSATTYGMNTSVSTSTYSGDFVDWGATMGTGWFTLSKDEWTYLFDDRTVNGGSGSGKSYTLGQSVNGKLGVVIYPDNYTGAEYSGSDWATFESAGCVFLPATGHWSGSAVENAGTNGGYWSATPYSTSIAYYVFFLSDGLTPENYDNRSYGYSVRLACEVE